MIGYEDYAETIAATPWHTRENEDGDIRLDSLGDVPEGWEYIGSGAYRHCFRGPDGNVYKVHTAFHVARAYKGNGNEASWDKYQKLMNTDARLAVCDYFTNSDVMVQEYVDGEVLDPDLDRDAYVKAAETIRAWSNVVWVDFHSGNFRMVNGEPVLIDW